MDHWVKPKIIQTKYSKQEKENVLSDPVLPIGYPHASLDKWSYASNHFIVSTVAIRDDNGPINFKDQAHILHIFLVKDD